MVALRERGDDQTVYGRIVVTEVSGRSRIGPYGNTTIPNRTTPVPPEIDEILTFFDDSVAGETLAGIGPGNSSERRLGALRNMIEMAGDFINQGRIAEACLQLQNVLLERGSIKITVTCLKNLLMLGRQSLLVIPE